MIGWLKGEPDMAAVNVAAGLAVVACVAACMLAGVAKADERIGAWSISRDHDAMTDAARISAAVYGEDTGIMVSCSPSIPTERSVTFVHLPYLGEGTRTLTYRFDEGSPVTGDWRYVDNAALVRYGPVLEGFLTGLAGAKRVRIRAVMATFEPVDADFRPDSASEMLHRLDQLCAAK